MTTKAGLQEAPAMGERRARWGLGYQDKVATERILNTLRDDRRSGENRFEGVRLADLQAARVDDFVLVWGEEVEGNSIKWSEEPSSINWGELIGASGLLGELAEGLSELKSRWPDKKAYVRLQSNRSPSKDRHPNQLVAAFSVSQFLRDHWDNGPTEHDSEPLQAVWAQIKQHTGLTDGDFARFVSACHLSLGHPQPPGVGPDTRDWQHYLKQFDTLHKAIATWITNHPTEEFVDRPFLLDALGFRGYRSGLIQRFPPPVIPYERNGTSADQLKHLIEQTDGGYLAVIGQAGVGKSTLVQDVLGGPEFPFFIPYYAFLPDQPGTTRDRGEALTFFQDVAGRLDKVFPLRHSLGIADVAEGRESLSQYMAKANGQYLIQGRKTILLIDGVDHVAREVGLTSSILNELPDPTEIPDGFLIILGSQPQGVDPSTVPAAVAHAVSATNGRRISVEGLSRQDILTIVGRAPKATVVEERDQLYDACRGNPLILTYILRHFQSDPAITVQQAIQHVGDYGGDVNDYYARYLGPILRQAANRELLGLLCRAAPTIPTSWLQTWPERLAIEDLYLRVLAPFVSEEEGNLNFLHHSLVSFLRSETRSNLPGADHIADERRFHSTLADRCGSPSCALPLGRAHVLHLLKAGRNEEVLSVLSSEWLRAAVSAFVPYLLVRPLLLAGLEAAWSLGKYGDVIRLILLDYELGQRTSRTEPGDLAETFLKLDSPELALSQVRSGGRILVDDQVALGFCKDLWRYGQAKLSNFLQEVAKTLYLQCKPVAFVYQGEPIDTHGNHDYYEKLRSWSEAAVLFEPVSDVITQVSNLQFQVPERGGAIDEANVKGGLLYGAFLTLLEVEADECELSEVLAAIRVLDRASWHFGALLNWASEGRDGVNDEGLSEVFKACKDDDDFTLAYASHLNLTEQHDVAKQLTCQLSHPRVDTLHGSRSFGYTDITFSSTLRSLQVRYKLPEGETPGVTDNDSEALARVEWAGREVGRLLGSDLNGGNGDLRATFRTILLFHNRPVVLDTYDWHKDYVVAQAKGEIYGQLVAVARKFGKDGIEALREEVRALVAVPGPVLVAAHHRRFFARELFLDGALTREEAVQLGLSLTTDADDEDPVQRQDACLQIASFLHAVGANQLCQDWMRRASLVSAGAGSHKDHHMSHLAEWLVSTATTECTAADLLVWDKLARGLDVAGGAGQDAAAKSLLENLMMVEPGRTGRLAVEFMDRGVLNLAMTLEGLILAGANSAASHPVLSAIYGELASLVDPGSSGKAAVAVLESAALADRAANAEHLMDKIRVNSLPQHRLEVARKIQDSLIGAGLTGTVSFEGLKAGRGDSSMKDSLYRLSSGEALSVDQVASVLSQDADPSQWNPNPSENSHFSWWAAIQRARVRSVGHLNALLATFPPDKYRNVDVLAWKSQKLLELGDRAAALRTADQAILEARDASWFRWYDGAQKKAAFAALKLLDCDAAVAQARAQFSKDLIAGRFNNYFLMADVRDIFAFLEIEWPSSDVKICLSEYLDGVLLANTLTKPFDSLTGQCEKSTPDGALCYFLVFLLAFPVVDIGLAARRALAMFVIGGGDATVVWKAGRACVDSVQLEHVLIALHLASIHNHESVRQLEAEITSLIRNDSVAVRSVARRICEELGWDWVETMNDEPVLQILLPNAGLTNIPYDEARKLVGGGPVVTANLYKLVFNGLKGGDSEEAQSDLLKLYDEIEQDYRWRDDARLKRWMRLSLAKFWLSQRAIIGREAAMRLLGRWALTGRSKGGAEGAYDFLYPLYDPVLEILTPVERPGEMKAMDWDFFGDEGGKAWLNGEGASHWDSYPSTVAGKLILAERSWFIRPDWEWPREERYRGLTTDPIQNEIGRRLLSSSHELTYTSYLRGDAQGTDQVTVLNEEDQLVGSQYRWIAFSPMWARKLGWKPAPTTPFRWEDERGELMVESIYWKDGWISLEPPRFESLGEGWLVLATTAALEQIKHALPTAEMQLWVERHSHGDSKYEAKWHLSKSLWGAPAP